MKNWNDYWSKVIHKPIIDVLPQCMYRGTRTEPEASMLIARMLDPVKDKFKEGFCLLDYGAGAGRVSNFVSERLSDFTYYGLEPDTEHGKEGVAAANKYLHDSRCTFGLIETDLESILSKRIDVVILISVFTHLPIEDILEILENLKKVFKESESCSIIFTCYPSSTPKLIQPQFQISKNYHGESKIDISVIQKYCDENGLSLISYGSEWVDGRTAGLRQRYEHSIYEIKKASNEN